MLHLKRLFSDFIAAKILHTKATRTRKRASVLLIWAFLHTAALLLPSLQAVWEAFPLGFKIKQGLM